MAQIVLDQLRQAMLDQRREGGARPKEARSRIYVTPSGRVVIGDRGEEGDERMLSEVHPAVFAAPRG